MIEARTQLVNNITDHEPVLNAWYRKIGCVFQPPISVHMYVPDVPPSIGLPPTPSAALKLLKWYSARFTFFLMAFAVSVKAGMLHVSRRTRP